VAPPPILTIHERCHEPFSRRPWPLIARSVSSKHEGTGLGLTLARKFVELHDGRIWVHSEVGIGSTFTVSLPLRPWPAS